MENKPPVKFRRFSYLLNKYSGSQITFKYAYNKMNVVCL